MRKFLHIWNGMVKGFSKIYNFSFFKQIFLQTFLLYKNWSPPQHILVFKYPSRDRGKITATLPLNRIYFDFIHCSLRHLYETSSARPNIKNNHLKKNIFFWNIIYLRGIKVCESINVFKIKYCWIQKKQFSDRFSGSFFKDISQRIHIAFPKGISEGHFQGHEPRIFLKSISQEYFPRAFPNGISKSKFQGNFPRAFLKGISEGYYPMTFTKTAFQRHFLWAFSEGISLQHFPRPFSNGI